MNNVKCDVLNEYCVYGKLSTTGLSAGSPESKRRSVHSSSSTRSSNRTAGSSNSHDHDEKVRIV